MNLSFGKLSFFLYRSLLPESFRQGPYRLNLAITKECHSKCTTCNIWNLPQNKKHELSLAEYQKIAKQFSSLRWLSLTGGEPTDRIDLPDIVETFAKHTPLYLINLSTNGLNRKRVVQAVNSILEIDVKKVAIAVSIDGPKEIHDQIRGIRGGYQLATETLKELLDLKKSSFGKLSVFASMTLQQANQNHIQETIDRLREIKGFHTGLLHFNFVHQSPVLYKNETVPFKVDPNLIPQFKSFSKRPFLYGILESIYLKNAKVFLEKGTVPISCEAISNSVHIDEIGNVFPCTIWDQNLGSLRENDYSILTILKNHHAQQIQKKAQKKDCPDCWSPCEAYQSIAANPKSAIQSLFQSSYVPVKASPKEIESVP